MEFQVWSYPVLQYWEWCLAHGNLFLQMLHWGQLLKHTHHVLEGPGWWEGVVDGRGWLKGGGGGWKGLVDGGGLIDGRGRRCGWVSMLNLTERLVFFVDELGELTLTSARLTTGPHASSHVTWLTSSLLCDFGIKDHLCSPSKWLPGVSGFLTRDVYTRLALLLCNMITIKQPAMPASPIASNSPSMNGGHHWQWMARAPIRRKLRDQPKLARKATKTDRSPKCCIWVIYMPRTYLPSLPHSPGHSRPGIQANLQRNSRPPEIQFTWLFQQKTARNVSEFH